MPLIVNRLAATAATLTTVLVATLAGAAPALAAPPPPSASAPAYAPYPGGETNTTSGTALTEGDTPLQGQAPCAGPLPGSSITLAQVRLDAQRCNADIVAARRAEEAGDADIQIASQRPNPVLSVGVENINPSAGVGSGSPRHKTVDSILRVDQVIETANKGGLRVDVARANREAFAEQRQAIVAQQLALVEQAYFEAAVSQERVDILQQMLALYGRAEQANQTRLKSGDVSRAEVTKLQLDALRAQSDLRAAQADHAADKAALAQAAGIPGTLQRNTLASAWPALDATLPAYGDEELQQRPDVTAAQARLRAAIAARDLARAGRVPDVTVGAQAEHYPTSPSNQQGSGNSFGVFVSIPLYVRHSYGGEARRAETDYYSALDDRNRVLLVARNELERAWDRVMTARQALVQMRDAVLPAAESVATSAEFAYSRGASGVIDLLDARRALRQTRLDAAAAQGDYAKAVSAYIAARRISMTPGVATTGANLVMPALPPASVTPATRATPATPATPAYPSPPAYPDTSVKPVTPVVPGVPGASATPAPAAPAVPATQPPATRP